MPRQKKPTLKKRSDGRFRCKYHDLQFYGNTPEEVMQDEEGLQIIRQLGRNMAWFLRLKEAGQAAGIPVPAQEEKRIATNFIR